MSDIVFDGMIFDRLREIGDQSDRIASLESEIERLRLTDAEREAVRFCVTASLPETEKLGGVAGALCRMHAATLRGLLERTK
jgi:hypothetical protein